MIFMKILYALTTEKAAGSMETSNTLTFVVADDASKTEIKKEAETTWGEKVVSVNTLRTINGRKKAIIKFVKKGAASQIAGKLKLI